MHRDIVFETPEGCQNLGFSAPCAIQGLYKPGKIISVQAHPEFNEYIMSKIVQARHDVGVFNDEMYKSGSSRAGNHHDGDLVAKRIIRFLQESAV